MYLPVKESELEQVRAVKGLEQELVQELVQGLEQELELTMCNQKLLEAGSRKMCSLPRGRHCHHCNTGCPDILLHHLGKPRSHQLHMFHLGKGLVMEMEASALEQVMDLALGMGVALGQVSHHSTTEGKRYPPPPMMSLLQVH